MAESHGIEGIDDAALRHLGFVLTILAELSPNDRCRALDEAQEFFNAACPNAQIEPMEGYVTRLVSVGPLDWPMKELVHAGDTDINDTKAYPASTD